MHQPTERISSRSQLPLIIIIGSLLVGIVCFLQQNSVRHLDGKIRQLQQNIDRLSPQVVTGTKINLAQEQIRLEKERINTENGIYVLLFQGIGAIFLGGLTYTAWRYLRRTDCQFQSSNDRYIRERFSQSIVHLASDKLEVRLGGIYTLESLTQESPRDHWTIVEILTAFVRERSLLQREEIRQQQKLSGQKLTLRPIATDVQAVMTILSRRDVSKDRPDRNIELRESNLRAADLIGVELWGADLWKVNLREAQLWQAKLAGAFLGRANLSNASLWKADLEGAYLWKANLEGANLEEANLEAANLEGSNLKDANLRQANLAHADLRSAIGLTTEQISSAIVNETTQLPDYLHPSTHQPVKLINSQLPE
jgi:uncharacterized protein YjbI with pentapeptide repeats